MTSRRFQVRRIRSLVGDLYDETSEAYLTTLDELRDVLRDAGFYVERRHVGEATLRAYTFKGRGHPLVNPRFFRPGSEAPIDLNQETLLLSVWSKNPPGLHAAIRRVPKQEGLRFVAAGEPPGKLRLHGDFVVPLSFQETAGGTVIDFAAMVPVLSAIRQHLAAAANRAVTKDLIAPA